MTSGHSIRGDALHLPLRDKSVDLIVTSPPYFALRSYQDGDAHYDGQVGSEETPAAFIDALAACTEEAMRVLRDDGNMFVNLGDKYAGSGGHNNSNLSAASRASSTLSGAPQYSQGEEARKPMPPRTGEFSGRKRDGVEAPRTTRASRRQAPDRYNQEADGVRAKSLMGLPWRYALRCIDDLGLILRAEILWSKPNGLPESVTDRVRRSHEQWFHLTKQGRHYAAIDEIREAHLTEGKAQGNRGLDSGSVGMPSFARDARGKLPGSVREVATEPLRLPDLFVEDERGWQVVWAGKPARGNQRRGDAMFEPAPALDWKPGLTALWRYAEQRAREGAEFLRVAEVDHFAAFPTEWPRWLIMGWSPPAVCLECGAGRWPVAEKSANGIARTGHGMGARHLLEGQDVFTGQHVSDRSDWAEGVQYALIGYACHCTPYTDHKATRSTGPTYRDGVDAGDYVSNEFGGQLGQRPKSGARRQYHLEGWTPPPSRPAVVLDIFGGTGTTAMVARSLGRIGLSVDLSMDYARLARWRITESGQGAKSVRRTQKGKQGAML